MPSGDSQRAHLAQHREPPLRGLYLPVRGSAAPTLPGAPATPEASSIIPDSGGRSLHMESRVGDFAIARPALGSNEESTPQLAGEDVSPSVLACHSNSIPGRTHPSAVWCPESPFPCPFPICSGRPEYLPDWRYPDRNR